MSIQHQLVLISLLLLISWSNAFSQVVINEFSAANYSAHTDNFNEYEDWIELYNTSNTTFNLSGYHLSDRSTNTDKWTFPSGTTIAPNGFLLVYASGRNVKNGAFFHTNFKITQNRNKEDIVFANPNGVIEDIHEIDITNQENHSWGRLSDGANEWGVMIIPTPGFPNIDVRTGYTAPPVISPAAGFYEDTVAITITSADPDAEIRYTLNGETPTRNSILYTEPFNIDETSVLKARAFKDDTSFLPSFIDFHTYFINSSHTMKVVSISGDEVSDLMYGEFIEPQGSFELFDDDGMRVSDATGEFNKHGNDSWFYNQRGIDYITRDQFGYDYAVKNELFDMFNTTNRDRFQRLILKAAANDNYPFESGGAYIRDAYIHTLSQLANLELDERTYEPCVMYVNGRYWGVYEIREKVDDHDYTDFYYDQGENDIDFIKTWGGSWEEYGSWDDWYALRAYIDNFDLTEPNAYAYVEQRLEVMSLIDYIILHSHNVSADWLNWNTAWWRGRNPNGGATKWRYILWDEDATFGHYINYSDIPDQGANADPCNPEEISDVVDFEGHIDLFSSLYDNAEFRALYINRYADLNNTYFSCDFMIPLLDSMINRIEPEMPRQLERWGGTYEGWKANVDTLRNYILQRCTIIDEAIADCYEDDGITGPYDISIHVQPAGAGKVNVNTTLAELYPWDGTYFGGVPLDLVAVADSGWMFNYWETGSSTISPSESNDSIDLSLVGNDVITAHFIPDIPCLEPEVFYVDTTNYSAFVSWDPVENVEIYEVRYREKDTFDDWINFSTGQPEFELLFLMPCTNYEVEVRAKCTYISSSFVEVDFQTKCNVGIDEPASIQALQIAPNPFSNGLILSYQLLNTQSLQIELWSLDGQRIQTYTKQDQTSGQQEIRLPINESLPSGIYFLRLMTEEGILTRRLVKE